MRVLSIIFVLCVMTVPAPPESDDDLIGFGNSFYQNCASAETITDKESSHANDMQGMFCLGYVEGLSMGVQAADISRATRTFCRPDGVTNLQLVRIIRKYINWSGSSESTLLIIRKKLTSRRPSWRLRDSVKPSPVANELRASLMHTNAAAGDQTS